MNTSTRRLTITTKANAEKILSATPNGRKFPYCTGKYEWHGSAKEYVGREIESVPNNVKAIYVERRADSYGPYTKMMCILEN